MQRVDTALYTGTKTVGRREGRMRKPRRLPLEQLAAYEWHMPVRVPRWGRLEDTPATDGLREGGQTLHPPPIDWAMLFGNDRPVEIEVGMGKGQFLLASALARPETNFFGIEVVRKYQLYATTRFAIRQLPNVRTVCGDARWVLHYFVPPRSVQAVHVYFPDPWWKARHKKRRLFTTEFVQDVARVLVAGGRLLIKTDVQEYFETMCSVIAATGAFQELCRGEDTATPAEFQTNFEKKARLRGDTIWRAEYANAVGAEVGECEGSATASDR